MIGRCQICGVIGDPCKRPGRDDLLMPEHCSHHHWEAVWVALGRFIGPILTPAVGRDYSENSAWEGTGEPIDPTRKYRD